MPYRRFGFQRVIRFVVAAVVVLLSCASCTELERVPHRGIDAQQLVGHVVRVTTIDGQVYGFRLLEVTEDSFVGEFDRVPFEQITLVERRDVSLWRTACLVGGGVLAAAGAFLLAFALTFDP